MSTDQRMGHDPLAWLMTDEPAPPVALDARMDEDPRPGAAEHSAADTVKDGGFDLGEEVTVAQAAALKGRLQRVLDGEGAIQLDGGRIERADGAGIQLLLAFVTAARERGRPLRWEQVSVTLTEAAHLAGVDEHLGLTQG